jgi:hypothetical protein
MVWFESVPHCASVLIVEFPIGQFEITSRVSGASELFTSSRCILRMFFEASGADEDVSDLWVGPREAST